MTARTLFASMNPMSESENETTSNPQIYEVGYLLVPDLPEEEVAREYSALKDAIVKEGAELISDEMPKKIPLAYSIEKVLANARHKFSAAYFGWVKFAVDREKISELKKKFDDNPKLIRFLLLKTVKENTIASKRFIRDIPYRRPLVSRKKEEKPATPINKEEIDKEIEAMVATE